MKRLEAIVHPIVGGRQLAFLEKAEADGHAIVVLDIPLLFETGGDKRADAILVVSAPPDVQKGPRPGARPDDRGRVRGDTRPSGSRFGEAEPRRFHHRHQPGLCRTPRQRVDEILAELRQRIVEARGNRDRLMREVVFDTETTGLNPITGRATASSRSAASS